MVNIDTVYQKVLAIANKEQRGYITPQEFNLLADKAQLEIINDYFHQVKMANQKPTNDEEISDSIEILREKMNWLKAHRSFNLNNDQADLTDTVASGSRSALYINQGNMPDGQEIYKISSIQWYGEEIDEVDRNTLFKLLKHPLLEPTPNRPVYTATGSWYSDGSNTNAHNLHIDIHPKIDGPVTVEYFKKPHKPNWGYVVVNKKALYNFNTSVNFGLHPSEEEVLVNRILKLSGIVIDKPQLHQSVMVEEQTIRQNQNN